MADNKNFVDTPADTDAESTIDPKKLAKLKGQLRAQAERTVVQRHQDEYHVEAEKLFAEHGLEFTRRLSAQEKREKELKEIIKNDPELARKYGLIKAEAPANDGPAVLETANNPF